MTDRPIRRPRLGDGPHPAPLVVAPVASGRTVSVFVRAAPPQHPGQLRLPGTDPKRGAR